MPLICGVAIKSFVFCLCLICFSRQWHQLKLTAPILTLQSYEVKPEERNYTTKKAWICLAAINQTDNTFPSRRFILKLPIIWYKVSTKALWHIWRQCCGATDDGNDSTEQRLIGDILWWLKVADRQEQSIEEHRVPLIALSFPCSVWQGRTEGERGTDTDSQRQPTTGSPQNTPNCVFGVFCPPGTLSQKNKYKYLCISYRWATDPVWIVPWIAHIMLFQVCSYLKGEFS